MGGFRDVENFVFFRPMFSAPETLCSLNKHFGNRSFGRFI